MHYVYDHNAIYSKLQSYEEYKCYNTEIYNEMFGTNMLCKSQCKTHYKILCGLDLDWDDIFSSYYSDEGERPDDTSFLKEDNSFIENEEDCKKLIIALTQEVEEDNDYKLALKSAIQKF